MTIRIIVQARVGSSRLPGKIMLPLARQPLLTHVVTRLRAAAEYLALPIETMVATTTDAGDDATALLCEQLGVACFRGLRDDVLARYLAASADLADSDLVVRGTADNPLYCPARTAAIIEHHLNSAADYTCIRELSYVVPEVMRAGALREMAGELQGRANESHCREHVTPCFRQPPHRFRVEMLPADWRGLRPDIRLTVDTPEEYAEMSWHFDSFPQQPGLPPLEEVYRRCSPSPTTQTASPQPIAA